MSTIEEPVAQLEREHTELKERVATLDGSFQFVSGQLRNMQTYMHDRFDQVGDQLAELRTGLAEVRTDVRDIKSELKALPRAIAEIIRESRS